MFFAALIASMTADVLSRGLMGQHPVFHVTVTAIPDLTSLPLFLALGILAGVLGVLFNRALLAAAFGRYPKPATAGQQMDLLGRDHRPDRLVDAGDLRRRPTTGGTDSERAGIHRSLDAGLLFGLRFLLTMGSYGTGAAGGIFAPLLVLGALLGLGIGELGREWFPLVAPEPLTVAVAGMAAYFTAIVRAPLTGIVLIVEMTGNYSLILPLFTACFRPTSSPNGGRTYRFTRRCWSAISKRICMKPSDTRLKARGRAPMPVFRSAPDLQTGFLGPRVAEQFPTALVRMT